MSNRPNILFVFSDQQRWDTMGCYGQRLNITPHLDQMASEGVKFEHAFTPQPLCGPCRACFQTAQYATQSGCFTNAVRLPNDHPTIAKALNARGYETAYVGKWHLTTDNALEENYKDKPIPPEMRGGYKHWMAADTLEFTSHGYEGYFFDSDGHRVDWEGYRVDKTTDYALDFLRDYATSRPVDSQGHEKPFFMCLSYIEPHHQNDLNRYIGPIGSKQRFADYDTPGDLAAFDSPGSPGPDWRQHYPDYLGCCWSLDQNMGRLREALKLYGLDENTLIVYTSDHGCHFRTRNYEYKRSSHEASIRVPLIVKGPGFEGGQTVDELVSTLSVPATILDAAGADPLPDQSGRSLKPLVEGKADDWPDDVFVQTSQAELGRAVRTKRWKYAVTSPDEDARRKAASDHYVETLLYDLENDPHELNNLVADPAYAEVRAELCARVKRHMTAIGEAEPTISAAKEPAGSA